jgi:hypothetical protein
LSLNFSVNLFQDLTENPEICYLLSEIYRADIPATQIDIPATQIDIPATRGDFPAGRADFPATQIDIPATRGDFPAGHADFPATRAESVKLPQADFGFPIPDFGLSPVYVS